jgi:hypothetical protein
MIQHVSSDMVSKFLRKALGMRLHAGKKGRETEWSYLGSYGVKAIL